MSNDGTVEEFLLGLNQALLEAIVAWDYKTYEQLCDDTLTCFEPEAAGNLVEGLDFHKYYFDLQLATGGTVNTTMVRPHVRMMGDSAAVLTYIRLSQTTKPDGTPTTSACEETRVWQKFMEDSGWCWKCVHFHRSVPSN